MSDYVFPATVGKVSLSSKKKDVLPEGPFGGTEVVRVDVPFLTVSLTFHSEKAAAIAARLAAYQGHEVTIGLEGEARQLNLM